MTNRIKPVHGLALAATVCAALLVTACEEEGPAEKAGKELDNAIEKVGDAVENAGDKVEDATDK